MKESNEDKYSKKLIIIEMSKDEIMEEIQYVKKIINQKEIIDNDTKIFLQKLGYTYRIIGGVSSPKIEEKEIKIMEFYNSRYLIGKYIVIGLRTLGGRGQGLFYRGYVKRIG